MSNEREIKFGTLNIDDGTTYTIESIEEGERKTVKTHTIPKSDGEIVEDGKRGALSISVKGQIAGADYDALRTNIDALKAMFQDGQQKFTLDDDRYTMAQLESFKKSFINMRRAAEFSADFVAHYPFWLSETEHEDDRIPTSGVGYVINNAGNAPARCKIEVTAPSVGISDNLKIENLTNGQSFQFRGDVAGYSILEVDNRYDTDAFEVLNSGADEIKNFEGDFITLEPGNNTIVVTMQFGSSVKITHRDCWF